MLTTISAAAMKENLLHSVIMNSSYENLLGSDIQITNTKDHPRKRITKRTSQQTVTVVRKLSIQTGSVQVELQRRRMKPFK
jgi:hypothetical protein